MKKKKYQVFDFNDEDERVEKISKKFLGKFSPKNNHTSPVDKYKFLQCCQSLSLLLEFLIYFTLFYVKLLFVWFLRMRKSGDRSSKFENLKFEI